MGVVKKVNEIGKEAIGVGPLARAITGRSSGKFGQGDKLGPYEQVKQAVYGAAAVGASPLIEKVVSAAPVTGARVANVLRGQQVMVHGTGNALQGNTLNPAKGSPASPDTAVVFGWNPNRPGSKDWLPIHVQEYAAGKYHAVDPQFNVVVGKAPKRAVSGRKEAYGENSAILQSTEPVRIESVVKSNVPFNEFVNNLDVALKKAGAPLRGDTTRQRLLSEYKRWQSRRADRNSTG